MFGAEVNEALLYEAVRHYQAGRRAGTRKTKTRHEVSGSGKKLWKQKGTGRARMGSIRSPLWRHGGTVHGPQPRDYELQAAAQDAARRAALGSFGQAARRRAEGGASVRAGRSQDQERGAASRDARSEEARCCWSTTGENTQSRPRRRAICGRQAGADQATSTSTICCSHQQVLLSEAAARKLVGGAGVNERFTT